MKKVTKWLLALVLVLALGVGVWPAQGAVAEGNYVVGYQDNHGTFIPLTEGAGLNAYELDLELGTFREVYLRIAQSAEPDSYDEVDFDNASWNREAEDFTNIWAWQQDGKSGVNHVGMRAYAVGSFDLILEKGDVEYTVTVNITWNQPLLALDVQRGFDNWTMLNGDWIGERLSGYDASRNLFSLHARVVPPIGNDNQVYTYEWSVENADIDDQTEYIEVKSTNHDTQSLEIEICAATSNPVVIKCVATRSDTTYECAINFEVFEGLGNQLGIGYDGDDGPVILPIEGDKYQLPIDLADVSGYNLRLFNYKEFPADSDNPGGWVEAEPVQFESYDDQSEEDEANSDHNLAWVDGHGGNGFYDNIWVDANAPGAFDLTFYGFQNDDYIVHVVITQDSPMMVFGWHGDEGDLRKNKDWTDERISANPRRNALDLKALVRGTDMEYIDGVSSYAWRIEDNAAGYVTMVDGTENDQTLTVNLNTPTPGTGNDDDKPVAIICDAQVDGTTITGVLYLNVREALTTGSVVVGYHDDENDTWVPLAPGTDTAYVLPIDISTRRQYDLRLLYGEDGDYDELDIDSYDDESGESEANDHHQLADVWSWPDEEDWNEGVGVSAHNPGEFTLTICGANGISYTVYVKIEQLAKMMMFGWRGDEDDLRFDGDWSDERINNNPKRNAIDMKALLREIDGSFAQDYDTFDWHFENNGAVDDPYIVKTGTADGGQTLIVNLLKPTPSGNKDVPVEIHCTASKSGADEVSGVLYLNVRESFAGDLVIGYFDDVADGWEVLDEDDGDDADYLLDIPMNEPSKLITYHLRVLSTDGNDYDDMEIASYSCSAENQGNALADTWIGPDDQGWYDHIGMRPKKAGEFVLTIVDEAGASYAVRVNMHLDADVLAIVRDDGGEYEEVLITGMDFGVPKYNDDGSPYEERLDARLVMADNSAGSLDGYTLSWSSSNKDVATIGEESGVLSSVTVGETLITCEAKPADGDPISASVMLYVDNNFRYVRYITVDDGSTKYEQEDEDGVEITYYPDADYGSNEYKFTPVFVPEEPADIGNWVFEWYADDTKIDLIKNGDGKSCLYTATGISDKVALRSHAYRKDDHGDQRDSYFNLIVSLPEDGIVPNALELAIPEDETKTITYYYEGEKTKGAAFTYDATAIEIEDNKDGTYSVTALKSVEDPIDIELGDLSCSVSISESEVTGEIVPAVTGVDLSTLPLTKGTVALSVDLLVDDEEYVDDAGKFAFAWSTDDDGIISVNEDTGVVTFIVAGTATVSCEATYKGITVTPNPVELAILAHSLDVDGEDETEVELDVSVSDDSADITLMFNGTKAAIADWEIVNDTIAGVVRKSDNTITVTPKAPGSTKVLIKITGEAGSVTAATLTVNVNRSVPVVKVSTSSGATEWDKRIVSTVQLSAAVAGAQEYDGDEKTDYAKRWSATSVPEGVATIDQSGLLTLLATGKVTVTCEALDGEDVKASDSLELTISESSAGGGGGAPVNTPVVKPDGDVPLSFTVPAGGAGGLSFGVNLSGMVFPADGSGITLTATVGGVSVPVTVTENGEVLFNFTAEQLAGLDVGTYDIVISFPGDGVNGAINIVVGTVTITDRPAPTPVVGKVSMPKTFKITKGFSAQLVTLTDGDIMPTFTKITSKNKKIATLDKDGVLTGVKTGKCVVYYKLNGKTKECTVTVVKNQYGWKKPVEGKKGTITLSTGRLQYMHGNLHMDVWVSNKTKKTLKNIEGLAFELYNKQGDVLLSLPFELTKKVKKNTNEFQCLEVTEEQLPGVTEKLFDLANGGLRARIVGWEDAVQSGKAIFDEDWEDVPVPVPETEGAAPTGDAVAVEEPVAVDEVEIDEPIVEVIPVAPIELPDAAPEPSEAN